MNRPTHYNRRTRFLEMVSEGIISKDQAFNMMLNWVSQDDIDNMLEKHCLKEIADGDLYLPNESYSEKCDKLDSGEYYSYNE